VGNVWEWCADSWHSSYKGAPTDGQVFHSGDENYRVLRGGSWFDEPRNARAAFRGRNTSGVRYDNYGFRVVRSQKKSDPSILRDMLFQKIGFFIVPTRSKNAIKLNFMGFS
jgi:hypothetical protein